MTPQEAKAEAAVGAEEPLLRWGQKTIVLDRTEATAIGLKAMARSEGSNRVDCSYWNETTHCRQSAERRLIGTVVLEGLRYSLSLAAYCRRTNDHQHPHHNEDARGRPRGSRGETTVGCN